MKQNKTILQVAIILTVVLIGAGSVLAEPKKKGKKQALTKQQIKNTLDQIEKYKPELAEQLRDIRKDDPKLFREKITYMHNQWSNRKQVAQKKNKKMMQSGKGQKAFGNKGKGPKQYDAGMMDRRDGKRGMEKREMDARSGMKRQSRDQRDMGKRKGRRQRGMGRGMSNRGQRQGERGMMQDRGRQGRGQRMGDDRRQSRRQRGERRGHLCQRYGADSRREMMGQRRGQCGIGHGMGRGMGDRGPRRPRDRQW
ncbi:MAG: hypothetical protein KAJ07_12935 [Planctomycetes bacterium]|nr:hypothetical protein [Planctomycetota bacterium]